jgi:hypothetical protein
MMDTSCMIIGRGKVTLVTLLSWIIKFDPKNMGLLGLLLG